MDANLFNRKIETTYRKVALLYQRTKVVSLALPCHSGNNIIRDKR